MINFDKLTATGITWTRCNRVMIDNPYGSPKSCKFFLEDLVAINNTTVKTERGFIEKGYNSQELIPLRNPETGELTGESVTHEYLYQILHSLFIKVGQEVS